PEAVRDAGERDPQGPLENENPADLRVRTDRDDAQTRAAEPRALTYAGLSVLRRQRTDQVEHDDRARDLARARQAARLPRGSGRDRARESDHLRHAAHGRSDFRRSGAL